jgi:hypothetical protein
VSVRRWTGTAVRASRLPASVSSFPLRDGTDLAAVHRQWKSPRHIRSPRCCHAPRPARLSSSPVVFSRGRSSGWICTEFRLRQVVPRSGGFAFRPSTGAIWITHKLFHPSARRARKSWVTALSVGLGSSQSLCPCTTSLGEAESNPLRDNADNHEIGCLSQQIQSASHHRSQTPTMVEKSTWWDMVNNKPRKSLKRSPEK